MGSEALVLAGKPKFLATVVTDQSEFDVKINTGPSFPMLSCRQGRWRVRAGDEEQVLKTPDGKHNLSAVGAVVIGANQGTYKAFYEKPFDPNADKAEAPRCWSSNGEAPSQFVTNPISKLCANCPKNAFGSKITEKGTKAKACSDSKRLLILPYHDETGVSDIVHMVNMPVMSLKNWALYIAALKKHSVPVSAVVTAFSLDEDVDYPLMKFRHIGWLDEAQYVRAQELAQSEDVMAFRRGEANVEGGTASEAPAPEVGKAPTKTTTASKAAPKTQAKPVVQETVEEVVEEVVEETTATSEGATDDEVGGILAGLDF